MTNLNDTILCSNEDDDILIHMTHADAKLLARHLRQMNNEEADQLATSLGSHLNICSATDETDELDESLNENDMFTWRIYNSSDYCDHGNPTVETFNAAQEPADNNIAGDLDRLDIDVAAWINPNVPTTLLEKVMEEIGNGGPQLPTDEYEQRIQHILNTMTPLELLEYISSAIE